MYEEKNPSQERAVRIGVDDTLVCHIQPTLDRYPLEYKYRMMTVSYVCAPAFDGTRSEQSSPCSVEPPSLASGLCARYSSTSLLMMDEERSPPSINRPTFSV